MLCRKKIFLSFILLSLLIVSCKPGEKETDKVGFTLVDGRESGIRFNNQITESDSINVYNNEYMYNGSGVGIGDFNNDGLQDVFFCGSMVTSRLYINKGDFQFEDITASAGLTTDRWCTGVSIVDINADGYPDIYVSASHSMESERRKNLLFINDGKLHFTEQANEYGLADTGYSTQAAFLDFDRDGLLDLYVLNHRLYNPSPNNLVPKDTSGYSPAADHLYRNMGTAEGQKHPLFRDVSIDAGIKEDGYGLGIVVTDVNDDNWPDVYIANDYIGNDLLWMNNKNGSFTNIISRSIQHQSFNSMGVDAADINNDGLPDVAVLDMSPENNERKKMMFSGSSQERYDMERRLGYEPGFVRNMLQLSNGVRDINGRSEPYYSEIGQLAGISETDWSWSILLADFDNDGWKDIHVTNGLAKDVTNNDYVTFKNSQTQQDYTFNGGKQVKKGRDVETIRVLRKNLDQYGAVRINNYFYHNNGDLTFSNNTAKMGMATPSVSNGCAYVDLDNDGDLDLVTNNMNEDCSLWRNELRKAASDTAGNFLSIQLKATEGNREGIGARVTLYKGIVKQFLEQSPVRGFSSSVDSRLHFGLGAASQVDSILVQWPDDYVQTIRNLKVNQQLIIDRKEAVNRSSSPESVERKLFEQQSPIAGEGFKHEEAQYFDFGSQRGVPQRFSQLGPAMATADVNGDGLTDYFIGGASRQSGRVFIQSPAGVFQSSALVTGEKIGEDLGAIFFDSDGDKDMDLLITGGSPEFGSLVEYNQPRLYNNDGRGTFTLNVNALPPGIGDITQSVATADYDLDGDLDVFIGGRLVPQKYPQSPRSYLLRNDKGRFTDVTREVCPALEFGGILTGVVFTDIDNDKRPDLVVCGEWMPVRIFLNRPNGLVEDKPKTNTAAMNGQWRSIVAGDLDADGDLDLVVGNMGLNNKYHLSPERPLKLYAADFDGNGFSDLIPAYFIRNNTGVYELFPGMDRTQLADQIPGVKKKYLYNAEFAKTDMEGLLKSLPSNNVKVMECQTTATVWMENNGNGQFVPHILPLEAQFAPVNAIVVDDLDADGNADILIAGNEYQMEVVTGRYDASYGLLLKGNGKGEFIPIKPSGSGFIVNGDVKSLIMINTRKKDKLVLAGINNQELMRFKVNR